MTGFLLYLRARRVVSVLIGFAIIAVLLVLSRRLDMIWSPLGGAAFPVNIVLPLGMAFIISIAEESETKSTEILASRPLLRAHLSVSAGYLVLGSATILLSLGTGYQRRVGTLDYGVETVLRNFLVLTALAWIFIPLVGGIRACVVPGVAAGLATTVFSGGIGPPAWNLLLAGSEAPPPILLASLLTVGLGFVAISRASRSAPRWSGEYVATGRVRSS